MGHFEGILKCGKLTTLVFGDTGSVAQLVRAPALQAGGHRFEPGRSHHMHNARGLRLAGVFCRVGSAPIFVASELGVLR
jgi:hypothetical protein